ncbi:MAG: hypothetical protein M1812_002341 [Candelaria pacifica]|nr:MAG: hypothetical protein M1812_002341 [Candelaria pacifica]
MSNQGNNNNFHDPVDFVGSSHNTPFHLAEVVSQPLKQPSSQSPGLDNIKQYAMSHEQLIDPLLNPGNESLADPSASLESEGAEVHLTHSGLPLQLAPEFRHPLVPLIPTINCLPSAFLDNSSAYASQSVEEAKPDEAGPLESIRNLQPQQLSRSDGYLKKTPHNSGYDSGEDEFSRSPGGRKHVDTLRDAPYLLTASPLSFQGIPPGPQSLASKARSPRPHTNATLPTTVRPLQPSTITQRAIVNANGVLDQPRGMKVLMTTLKNAIYDATSPSKQRLFAEKFKNKTVSPSRGKRKHKRRGAKPQDVPGEYSWWEKNSDDDSDTTVDLEDFDKNDPAVKAIEVFRGDQAKQWQNELQQLQREQNKIGHESSGPPSLANMSEKDLLLRNLKKQIQVKLQNDFVLILQKLPPAALNIKVSTCAHPFCLSPNGCSPAGTYRLSLEPVENLGDAIVPTVSLVDDGKGKGRARRPPKEQKGQAANGATWYCLICLEGLWNGVGQIPGTMGKNRAQTFGPRPPKERRSIPHSRGDSVQSSFVSSQQSLPPGELPELSNSQDTLQSTSSEQEINLALDGTNDDMEFIPDRYRGPLSAAVLKAAEQAGAMVSVQETENAGFVVATPTKSKAGVRAASAPITPSRSRTAIEDSVSPLPNSPEAYIYSTRSTPEGRSFMFLSRKRRANVTEDLSTAPVDSGYITEASPIELLEDQPKLATYPRNCDTLSDRIRRQRQTDNILKALKGISEITTTADPATKRHKLFASPIRMQRRPPDTQKPVETEALKAAKKLRSRKGEFIPRVPDIPDYYCTCHKPDDGPAMIKCCNELCLYGWFHLACTELSKVPDDDVLWYCAACSAVFPKIETVAPQAMESNSTSDMAKESAASPSCPQPMNLDGPCDTPKEQSQTPNTTGPSTPSRPTTKKRTKTPKTNPRKRRHSPSPEPLATTPTLTPFANDLSSFIYAETRAHSSGYYTLSAPQNFALQKWKSTITRQQMFETPRNRAFLSKNNLLYKYDEINPDSPLENIKKAEDAPTRGVMEIGGLVVEVSAAEVRNQDLSAVLKGVDQRVGIGLRRLGYVDRPYKGNLTLKVGRKEVVEVEGEIVSSGDEETSSSGNGVGAEEADKLD